MSTTDDRDQVAADCAAGGLPGGSPLQVEATGDAVQAEAGAQQHHDRADTLDARAADVDGDTARREPGAEVGGDGAQQCVPALPGVWQDGHPRPASRARPTA